MALSTQTTPATPGPLTVSSEPWPGDIRLVLHVQPDADLGFINVQLGLGRGTKGRGKRAGDDHMLYVATLYKLAQHLSQYASEYDEALREDRN